MGLSLALTVLAALGGPPRPAAAVDAAQLWVGHHVTLGKRTLPVVGQVQTRVDAFLLLHEAGAAGGPAGLPRRLRRQLCALRLTDSSGIQSALLPGAAVQLRLAPAHLKPLTADTYRGQWGNRWDAADQDGDGHPGLTVAVAAPLCAGRVYLRARSFSAARVRQAPGVLYGEEDVHLQEQVLGASNACLRLLAPRGREALGRGTFRWERWAGPAPDCASLDPDHWPVRAANPQS